MVEPKRRKGTVVHSHAKAKHSYEKPIKQQSFFAKYGIKFKHLILLPLFAFLQIIIYYVYLERNLQLMEERNIFLTKHINPDSSTHWNDYRVIQNYKNSSSLEKVTNEDISITSQCSVNNLWYLIDMSSRWKGQISVSVFVPENDAVIAVYAISAISRCYPVVNELVTFSLVWPTMKPPAYTNDPDPALLSSECSDVYEILTTMPGSNYGQRNIPYPHNTLRNVAKKALQTDYMFLLDIDTLPSENARNEFLDFANGRELFKEDSSHMDELNVYVAPAWEVLEDVDAPTDKQNLLELLDAERIRPFHNETCWYCHKTTRYEDWIEIDQAESLSIAYEVDWESSWEPYYISTVNSPNHDERFRQYGYDRISQICELYMAGYRFFVLNNLFTVHQGYKRIGGFHMEKNMENRRNFLIFEDQFQPEMLQKYPDSNRTCRHGDSIQNQGRAQIRNNIQELMKIRHKRLGEK